MAIVKTMEAAGLRIQLKANAKTPLVFNELFPENEEYFEIIKKMHPDSEVKATDEEMEKITYAMCFQAGETKPFDEWKENLQEELTLGEYTGLKIMTMTAIQENHHIRVEDKKK